MPLFKIIQGGMGVAVSNWELARAVSSVGQLGVVSGTGLAIVFARRLQLGDPGGHLRRAVAAFPYPDVARRIVDQYFIEGGKPAHKPFKTAPLPDHPFAGAIAELTVLANFAEVWLAKEGHAGVVGINFLEKIQLPMPAQLYGAMLAGVDYVLIGAGIPRQVPGVLDALAQGRPVDMRLDVDDARPGEEYLNHFDPASIGPARPLKRPAFYAIVSSATLAMTLARKSNGAVDGFVVESSLAGGHNAPPRGPLHLTDTGEPIYSDRDNAELDKIRELGKPFYLAGGCASHERVEHAISVGASGVQVGTAFAFCDESGITPALKQQVLELDRRREVRVFTDPAASPTSFPFKVVQLDGTLSEASVYDARRRVCDMGYLRRLYRKEDGTIGHRCSAEPVDAYVRKGGRTDDTAGRKCICNALFATIGLPQTDRNAHREPPIVTAGSTEIDLTHFTRPGHTHYTAKDVIETLLNN